ncbi:protein FATTY ACID EXPORT 1, chloroplastic [Alnus glutinosa]|uniref:protein FATTY ACID EXPORT 1, chloroplastic n=1 Tax=Alnus glutinosa TaxID=3517 RepID=UPI002D76DDEF|nr:protein FATTY ACID EXPORT 1, chloroplastic [Alnus glutinosa]
MAATISQLSCFAAVNGGVTLRRRLSFASPSLRCSKFTVFMSLEGRRTDASSSDVKSTLRYTADASELNVGGTSKSYPDLEEDAAGKLGMDEPVLENDIIQPKRGAKIHDFCFGIPFGGLVLSGGLLGFVFSRNPATLTTGVLYGGALLALSTFSLKIWRQGKSSLPFILGQAALSAVLLWKNFQAYSLTKKVFPTGFYAAISAAMLCFYSYVLISGGNPPPKKLKSSPSVASW